IRSQIDAVDYNDDGKLDLLVGDFCTTMTLRPDLTPAERVEFDALRDEQAAAWSKAYQQMRNDAQHMAAMERAQAISEELQEYLLAPAKKGTFEDYALTRGYVRLYLRK